MGLNLTWKPLYLIQTLPHFYQLLQQKAAPDYCHLFPFSRNPEFTLILLPSGLKQTYSCGSQWQNTNTPNTNQEAIKTLAAIAMVTTTGHRPVSPTQGEPARMPWGHAAAEQVSANKQSGRAEKEKPEMEKTGARTIVTQTPTQKRKMQPWVSSFIPFFTADPGAVSVWGPAPEWANVYD